MTHNNPLIEKYNQIHKKPEPPKDPYSHLRYEDIRLILDYWSGETQKIDYYEDT
jgi:hypothetical protein